MVSTIIGIPSPGGFLDDAGDHDAQTRSVIDAVQRDGTCWLSGMTWHGVAAIRISVSSWATGSDDVERSLESIERAAAEARLSRS
jgi:hypothetical protein